MKKRILALALSLCMALSLMPQAVFAADHVHDASCGYKEAVACGHTAHDGTCGYVEAVAASACTHTDGCPETATPSDAQGQEAAACTHDDGCGYAEAVTGQPCKHENGEHDDTCGYSAGAACTYSAEPAADSGAEPASQSETTYTVTIHNTVTGTGTTTEQGGSISGAGNYSEGVSVTLTATPNEGYDFLRWNVTQGGISLATETTVSFTMPAENVEITAQFHPHTFNFVERGEAGHQEDCINCDLTRGDVIPHSDSDNDEDTYCDTCGYEMHTHDYTAVVTEPTCGERGYTTYTCSCRDSYVSDYVDALGHDWGDYESDGNGYHTRTCTTDSGHYQTEKCGGGTATCKDLATCSDCGVNYGSLNSTNHTGGTEIRNAKGATESEDGYTGDTYCLGCGYKLSEGDTIPATGSGDDDDDTHTHNYSYYKYDGTNHWKMCHCGQGQAGSVKPHSLVIQSNNNGHWKECTVCNYYSDIQAHVYSNDSDVNCNDCGYERHVHSFPTATCITPAVCSCGSTYEGKNPNNHAGGTEIRDAAEATIVAEGYTGDTYCLGCGSMIASGEVIPKAGVIFDGPGVEDVTFIPAAGTELPEDAEIIVSPHTPSADNLAYVLGIDADTEYLDADNVKIQIVGGEDYTAPDGTEYRMHEIIIINGEEYLITNYMGMGDVLVLMRLSDGATGNYNVAVNKLDFTGSMNGTVQEYAYDKINIGGITYDVRLSYNSDAGRVVVLYYNGSPAGKMYINEYRSSYFREGFDPETLKTQQNANDLGTVTTGETPIDGLESGKTYNVSVIGSNDISVPGAENVTGTITQTFDIPVQFVNNPNVKYVAVHVSNPYAEALEEAFNAYQSMNEKLYEAIRQYENGEISLEEFNKVRLLSSEALSEYMRLVISYDEWEEEHAADNKTGNDLGIVTISDDGKTLTATYTVNSFSPFTVYAFIEADEPEIKTLTTNAEPVGSEDDVPTSPETGDNTPAYVTYTVQRGDTLWAIAKKYGCTVAEIVAVNSDLIKNPDLIYAGWQLKIPQAGATGNAPDAILPEDKKTGVYIVKRGDTLWAISKMYGCTVAEIVALNGELITDPNLIFAGWELLIPQD